MNAPHRILVATDFSPMARRALDLALSLAAACDASVTLLHVYELPQLFSPPSIAREIVERIRSEAEQSMSDLVGSVRDRFPRIEAVLREGDPRERINLVAAERGSELLVVGTHGRRGLARALIGSVAEWLVRTSAIPVLTVGPEGAVAP